MSSKPEQPEAAHPPTPQEGYQRTRLLREQLLQTLGTRVARAANYAPASEVPDLLRCIELADRVRF